MVANRATAGTLPDVKPPAPTTHRLSAPATAPASHRRPHRTGSHADRLRARHCSGLRAARHEPRTRPGPGTDCASSCCKTTAPASPPGRWNRSPTPPCRSWTTKPWAGSAAACPGQHGMLARQHQLAHAAGGLARWCRHHGLLADDIALHLTTTGDTATLAITEARDWRAARVLPGVGAAQCPRPGLLDGGPAHPLIAAEFAFDAPPHADAYAVLFRGPSTFAPRAPPSTLTPATCTCPCAATNRPCARCCSTPCPDRAALPPRPPAGAAPQRASCWPRPRCRGQPAHALPQHSAESPRPRGPRCQLYRRAHCTGN